MITLLDGQNREKRMRNYLWMTIGISLLLAIWVQWPRIQNPMLIEEDMRSLFWIRSYTDAELFPHAPYDEFGVTRYQLGNFNIAIEDGSPGYSLLMFAGSQLLSPVLFSKLLVFPLTAVAAFYAFHIGIKLRGMGEGVALGITVTALALASSTSISLDGGLHRSFALPGLLALLWYLMNRHYWKAAGVLVILGVIYLPIFPVTVMTFFLSAIRWRMKGHFQPRIAFTELLPLVIAVPLVIITVSPLFLNSITAPTIGTEPVLHILHDPYYGPEGRRNLFILFPIAGRAGIVNGGVDFIQMTGLAMISLFIWLIVRRMNRHLPSVFHHLFFACCIGFALSWTSIIFFSSFLLYLPNRHTRFGFFLLLVIYVVLNGRSTVQIVAHWLGQQADRMVWYATGVTIILALMALFLPSSDAGTLDFFRGEGARILLVGSGFSLILISALLNRRREGSSVSKLSRSPSAFGRGKKVLALALFLILILPYLSLTNYSKFYLPEDEQMALFSYLEMLPKDVLLSGDPCSLDSVQFFAGRDILFNCERFGFLENEEQVVLDSLRAYYASKPETVAEYCRRYGIDYLVVNTERFSSEWLAAEKYFFEPYNTQLIAEVNSSQRFVLNEVPESDKLFVAGKYFVMPCHYFAYRNI